MAPTTEPEWHTRKRRIDPRLDDAGWPRGDDGPAIGSTAAIQPHRTEETETDHGPADYVLWLGARPVATVEAKKVAVGAQEVLKQAERYARGLRGSPFDFDGLHVPFLYSTNGEVIWFRDVRDTRNLSRQIAAFHTPGALAELLDRDVDAACTRALDLPHDHPWLRPYQKAANAAVERAIADRKREMLLAMATGTGKTVTLVNQIYRLMKTGVARRALFLVDRRALAAQAVRTFASFEAEPGRKFNQIYEDYSSRFQTEDFGEEDRFDPKVMPAGYLTDPQAGHAFVYVCTIQRMAINILGRSAVPGLGEESLDEDVDRLPIPIHAFDLIVADECHRGYTAQELSVWRATLDHFDALKIGLTATPAAHTSAYFRHKVFTYSYAEAVRDGFLVEYDMVNVHSEVRLHGVFLREGEHVEVVDPATGLSHMDRMEDERQFDTADVERRVTAPESNRRILEEVRRHALEHEARYGRFPKTLVFAVNDLPHTSHADQLVALAREVFGRGETFVEKITGHVDRPLQRIREFRNRPNPAIAVTVDLLTTGVDIPDLEFLVFLRPVKSRILFEQMLGRGTRRGERYRDKSHFTVFDCFDGTLFAYFRQTTGMTDELPTPPGRAIGAIIADIWDNRDRRYNTGCLARRLQRIDKEMSGAARALFAAFVPDGDLARFARTLPPALERDFVGTMARLRDPDFQALLTSYPRPERIFYVAPGVGDEVTSTRVLRDGSGAPYKPEDYLVAFERYVREHEAEIAAIHILLTRPRDWSADALDDLRRKLATSPFRFTVENLQRAHEVRYRKALVDIISMVKHAADDDAPLLTAAE